MGVGYHAHLLSREMYAEILPSGSDRWIDLGSSPIWSFDDQGQKNLLNWGVVLRTNDTIQVSCVMNSTGRTTNTTFGINTWDEMCWASFSGWPRGAVGKCTGPVWTGTLTHDEPGLGLARRHPVEQASNVWDGRNVLQGGRVVRVVGKSCVDQIPETCPVLAWALNASKANGTCSKDLGYLSPQISGTTLPWLCCASACPSLCSDSPDCAALNTTLNVSGFQSPVVTPTLTRCPAVAVLQHVSAAHAVGSWARLAAPIASLIFLVASATPLA